jgi:hypothetical protein
MLQPSPPSTGWIRASVGLLALLGCVGVPIEITLGLAEQPVVPPPPAVTILIVGSCLLLIWSGLGLRRLAAGDGLEQPPSPSA